MNKQQILAQLSFAQAHLNDLKVLIEQATLPENTLDNRVRANDLAQRGCQVIVQYMNNIMIEGTMTREYMELEDKSEAKSEEDTHKEGTSDNGAFPEDTKFWFPRNAW